MTGIMLFIVTVFVSIAQTNGEITCKNCTELLMKTVDDIAQDILYARGIIDEDRVSNKLMKKLDELDLSYEEHKIGLIRSKADLTRAINNFLRQRESSSITSDVSLTEDAVFKLEKEVNKTYDEVFGWHSYNNSDIMLLSEARDLETSLMKINERLKKLNEETSDLLHTEGIEAVMLNTNLTSLIIEGAEIRLRAQRSISYRIGKELSSLYRRASLTTKETILEPDDSPTLRYTKNLFKSLKSLVHGQLNFAEISALTEKADIKLRKSLYNLRDMVTNIKSTLDMSIPQPSSLRNHPRNQGATNGHSSILGALQVIV